MISPKFGLPLIRDGAGKAVAFDMAWLRTTLASAATKAGHHGWWLADDLAVGITMFLRDDYPNSVIDLSELEVEIQTVLRDVGYAEVARTYQTVMPYHQISLVRCLQYLPQNDQPGFYCRLGDEIAKLSATQPQHIHFSDLQECIRVLMACKRMRRRAEATRCCVKLSHSSGNTCNLCTGIRRYGVRSPESRDSI